MSGIIGGAGISKSGVIGKHWQNKISWNVGLQATQAIGPASEILDFLTTTGGSGDAKYFVEGFTWNIDKKFHCPSGQGGMYMIGCNIMLTDSIGVDVNIVLRGYQNAGSGPAYWQQARKRSHYTNEPVELNTSGMWKLNDGDTVHFELYHNHSGSVNEAAAYNAFWGFQI